MKQPDIFCIMIRQSLVGFNSEITEQDGHGGPVLHSEGNHGKGFRWPSNHRQPDPIRVNAAILADLKNEKARHVA